MNKHSKIVLTVLLLLTGCTGTMPTLGVENGRLMDCPATPNCVSSQAKDENHFIEPLRIAGTPLEAKSHILKILNAMKRSKITEAEDNYIRGRGVYPKTCSLIFQVDRPCLNA